MCNQWYVVFVRANSEKKVTAILNRKNIEFFQPECNELQTGAKGRQLASKMYIPSYLLVKIKENEMNSIRRIEGVISFAYWLNKPAVLREVEVRLFRIFMKEHPIVHAEKIKVCLNEEISINGEPSHDNDNLQTIRCSKVKLIFPSLGYSFITVTEPSPVDVILLPSYKPLASFAIS